MLFRLNRILCMTVTIILLIGLSVLGETEKAGIFLRGIPVRCIVVPENPESSANYAAEELARCLSISTGLSLPIIKDTANIIPKPAFVIGESRITEAMGLDVKNLQREGFHIRTDSDYIAIVGDDHPVFTVDMLRKGYEKPRVHRVGGTRTGTVFGVYTFLKKYLGADWYFQGPLGEVIPKLSSFDIPEINIKTGPSFEQRKIWIGADNTGTDELQMPEVKDSRFQTEHVWRMRSRQGMSWSCPGAHSMHCWGEYFGKEHPEYFSLVDGKRTNDWGWTANKSDAGRDFCWANPGTIKQQTDEMRLFFGGEVKRHPWIWIYMDKDYFPIGANDGTMRICECDLCRKWYKDESAKYPDYYTYYKMAYASELFFYHVSEVAKVAKKEFPDKRIIAMAYGSRLYPPEKVVIPDNVKIALAGVTPALEVIPKYKEASDKLVADWRKLCEIPLLWEYSDSCRSVSGEYGIPLVMPHLVAIEIKSRAGIVGGFFFCQGESPTGPYTQPELYVATELMWDVNQGTEKILDRFYTGLYGAAAPDVRACYEYLESIWIEEIPKICTEIPEGKSLRLAGKSFQNKIQENLWTVIFTPEKLKKALGYLKSARKSVKKYSPEWIRLNRCEAQLLKTLGAAAANNK